MAIAKHAHASPATNPSPLPTAWFVLPVVCIADLDGKGVLDA